MNVSLPAPEPTPGRKDVSLSSGSYIYTDEESEGAPKTMLKPAAGKSGEGECPATRTPPSRTRATSPTKSPEPAPKLSKKVSKPAAPVTLKENSRSSAPVRHGDAVASRASHHHGDKRVRSRSRSRHSRDRRRGTSRRRTHRNKPHPDKGGHRDDRDRESTRRRARSRSPSREPIQRKHAGQGQVSSNAKQRKEKKYPDGVVCEYCGKELQSMNALWQHQESSNMCREYQGKGDARKPCAS